MRIKLIHCCDKTSEKLAGERFAVVHIFRILHLWLAASIVSETIHYGEETWYIKDICLMVARKQKETLRAKCPLQIMLRWPAYSNTAPFLVIQSRMTRMELSYCINSQMKTTVQWSHCCLIMSAAEKQNPTNMRHFLFPFLSVFLSLFLDFYFFLWREFLFKL